MSMMVKHLIVRTRTLVEDPSSGVHGDVWAALERAANELREPIDEAEKLAEDAIDLPSWNGKVPNWDEAIKIAECISVSTTGG